ncbi:MAG: hypothetical protein GXP37_13115 [Chloroflexi bacterium]|nr:hypothetical protein [Chloroflexota bacterium]
MSQALQTDISILSLARGRRERYTPTIRVIEPASGIAPAAGKGNLYLLLEVEGSDQGRAKLYREILNTIQETYYYHEGDVISALTAALQAIHAHIQAHNRSHHTAVTAGVTCLVATGAEIVSAQAGPTILAVRSSAGLQWFSPLNDDDYVPLGADTPPSIEIGQTPGEPDIVVVAMNSAWANHLEVPVMLEATSVPRSQAVADQLAGVGIDAPDELNLLIVTLSEAGDHLTERPHTSTAAMGTSADRAMPSASIPAVPAQPSEPVQQSPAEPAYSPRSRPAQRPRPSAGNGIDLRAALGPITERAPRPRRRHLSPVEKAERQERKRRGPSRRIPFVLGIVALLALATVVVVAGMWYYQGRQRAQLFSEYMQGAKVNYNAAQTTTDAADARKLLQAALEQLGQAEYFSPENPDILKLRNQIAETRARLNQVIPLLSGFDLPLISFDSMNQTPTQVFADGLSVYVLDTKRGVLERYQLDENTGDRLGDRPAEVLVQKGMTVGGRRVGELAFAVWAPASGNRLSSGVLVLDRSNQLFNYSDGVGITDAKLAENPDLGFVSDMVYYLGNIYLLDKPKSQIWRYKPEGDVYDLPPEPYFSSDTVVNLAQVIDVAIDGAVWLLHPNGAILRFFGGVQEAFALDPIDPPFSDAVAIWTDEADPPQGRMYLADAASNRILAFDKSGALLAQLMPVDHPQILNSLRSIYVDVDNNYLYVLTASALYQIPIPRLEAER